MRITEFKNEDAIDVLADLIEPASAIFADEDLRKAIKENKSYAYMAKVALKNHKSEVIEILATLDGKTVEEYTCNPLSLLTNLISLLSDKELKDFFVSQAIAMRKESSTSVMENIQADEK